MVRVLPENVLRLMTPEDRRSAGQMTLEEAAYVYRTRAERQQHNIYINWLNQQKWFIDHGIFFHDNATKKRTGHKGDPDFQICYLGQSLWLEFKTAEGRLSGEQIECHQRMLRAGHYCHLPLSAFEAITITREWVARLQARAAAKAEVGKGLDTQTRA